MAEDIDLFWAPDLDAGQTRAARRGGRYRAYVPGPLADRPLRLPPGLSVEAAQVERSIRSLESVPGARGLAAISRLLTRSEAIASSKIEGVAPSSQQVALAELGLTEDVRGVSAQAQLVANNIAVLRRASVDLVSADLVTVDDIVALHAALLPDERHRGLRDVQNWIGGSDWNPMEAEFVPPPPGEVSRLVADSVAYLNGATHGALVQAGVLHAQFETIHPFADGNGRVGRALIHTVLARRSLSPNAVLPISLALATFSDRYVDNLGAYRYTGDPSCSEAYRGQLAWLGFFIDAARIATEQAREVAREVAEVEHRWAQSVADHRRRNGLRAEPRADSATARVMALLTEAPVLTARTVERVLGVSFNPARLALEELASAGVLRRKTIGKGTTGYLARDVLDLVTIAERRMASTRFDTRVAPPNRPVPGHPG